MAMNRGSWWSVKGWRWLLGGLGMLTFAVLAYRDTTHTPPARQAPSAAGDARPHDSQHSAARAPTPREAAGALDADALSFDLDEVMQRVRHSYRAGAQPNTFTASAAGLQLEAASNGVTLRLRGHDTTTLQLGPSHIERGDKVLTSTANASATVQDDGHLAIDRGATVEHYRNDSDGIEQSWTWAAKPQGVGDLRVRIPVRGLGLVAETDTGLHFADASTGHGVRYGHATWIDAQGMETSMRARHVAGAIELVVPSRVVESATYPAVLDPIISAEAVVDPMAVMVESGAGRWPALGSNGTQYLAVWAAGGGQPGDSDLYAMRLSATGLPLDPSGIPVSTGFALPTHPVIASNGSDYLVVWEQQNAVGGDRDVYGVRISGAGLILDSAPIPIANTSTADYQPAVASDGADYLVVWSADRAGVPDVYARRVSADGTMGDPLAVANDTMREDWPAVASNGSDYLVAWRDTRSGAGAVYATRIALDGTRGVDIAIAEPSGAPLAASNGTDYLVVWTNYGTNGGQDDYAYGTRVSAAGAVLDPTGFRISTRSGRQIANGVVSNGTNYFVTWADYFSDSYGDIYSARIATSGVTATATELRVSSGNNVYEWDSAVASNGTDYLIGWQRGFGASLRAARVTGAGALSLGTQSTVSFHGNPQQTAKVANSGSQFLIVWRDLHGTSYDIYGARVSLDGVVIDNSAIRISSTVGEETDIDVASNGADFLVVWQEAAAAYGARVAADGSVLDSPAVLLPVPGAGGGVSVASDGTDYLILWSARPSAGAVDLYGARFLANGTLADINGFAISSRSGNQSDPSAVWSGSEYFVVWQDYDGGSVYDIYGARVLRAGTVDTTPILMSTRASRKYAPQIAHNGSEYLVAWSDVTSSEGDVYCTRVRANGEAMDPGGIEIRGGSGSQYLSDLTADGGRYFATWHESSDVTTTVRGARVRGSEVEAPVEIGAGRFPSVAPAAAAGSFVVAYERYVPEQPFGTWRVRARVVRFGANGETCGSGDDCELGNCIDGVCCDTRCTGGALDCFACSVAAGAPSNGTCAPIANGRACNDALDCTQDDTCSDGVCIGPSPCMNGTSCEELGSDYACGACPAGTYSTNGTGRTACIPCASGMFATGGSTTCASPRTCGDDEFQTLPPDTTRDRQCASVSTCSGAEFETVAPTTTSDRVCQPLTVCDVTQFETTPPTATSDRVCQPLTVCDVTQFETTPPTATSDRGCTACTLCAAMMFEVSPCTATADRVCQLFPPDDLDSGALDADVLDGSTVDGSVSDAASMDSASADANLTDATGSDSAVTDSAIADADTPDSAIASDASMTDTGPGRPPQGCKCSTLGMTSRRSANAWLALPWVMLVWMRARRRRRLDVVRGSAAGTAR